MGLFFHNFIRLILFQSVQDFTVLGCCERHCANGEMDEDEMMEIIMSLRF